MERKGLRIPDKILHVELTSARGEKFSGAKQVDLVSLSWGPVCARTVALQGARQRKENRASVRVRRRD